MARRKIGSSHTTISIRWEDKELFRRFAKLVKETRNGNMYESDAVVFRKILEEYITNHGNMKEAHTTYPSRNV
jgi:hypothetical protein